MTHFAYVVYDSYGEIVRRGKMSAQPQTEITPPVGFYVAVGDGAYETHHVSNGVLTSYSAEQAAAKAARPLFHCRWSNATMSWVDLRTLEALRTSKWAEIKASRDAAIVTPKATPHGTFDAKPEDQNNLSKVIDLVRVAASRGAPTQANYTLATNERVTLTLTELEDAALAIGAQVQALFDQGDVLRQQIDAANTPAEVEAITWPES